jgi:hypothetical protein
MALMSNELDIPPEPLDTQPDSSVSDPPQEEELDEVGLRELYQNEEIARFLNFFTDHVTEVREPTISGRAAEQYEEQTPALSCNGVDSPVSQPSQPLDSCMSETIAQVCYCLSPLPSIH